MSALLRAVFRPWLVVISCLLLALATASPYGSARRDGLVSSRSAINFENLAPGALVHDAMVLRNLGDEPIKINRFRTSCECVSVEPASCIVPPHGDTPIQVTLNMNHNPDFQGQLCIEITALGAEGEELLRLKANVSVGK